MSQNAPLPLREETATSVTSCKNCHSPMPSELRFCRNCGYRMGEGTAEYTETVRLPNGVNGSGAGSFGRDVPVKFGPAFGTGQQLAPTAATCGLSNRQKKRMSGMSWIFIAIAIFFISGAMMTRFARRHGGGGFPPPPAATRSAFGIHDFNSANGGVSFAAIEAPGSPADKAGLVGGDIVTSFDGHAVHSQSEMTELLAQTPIGKTVDLVYIRDGDTRTTTLTTISKADLDQLGRAFASRPQGQGKIGIRDYDTVEIAGTKLHGVRLGTVDKSLPADMAGLKNGDVVMEFNSDGQVIPIRTGEELAFRIQRAIPYSTVQVVIMRGAERMEIPVKIGSR